MGARVFVWLGGALFVTSLGALRLALPDRHWAVRAAASTLVRRRRRYRAARRRLRRCITACSRATASRPGSQRVIPTPLLRSAVRLDGEHAAARRLRRVAAGRRRDLRRDRTAGGRPRRGPDAWRLLIIARAASPESIRSNWPAFAGGRDRRRCRSSGPYRWVRHPLYLGWLLMVFGAAHMTGDRLVFAAITTIYLLVAIPWEERSLRRSFGAAYGTLHARRCAGG